MCRVMGIVNVTPDSFSDGGRFNTPEEAVRRARNLADEGADIVDIGGESTRPGSVPLSWEEEWSRIEPVLARLLAPGAARLAVSVDTYHPETAARAIALGVKMINCVYADSVPAMAARCAENAVELVIPYRLADSVPASGGTIPVGEYLETLRRAEVFTKCAGRLYLDPMIGFGTTREEDLALLKSIPALAESGRVLVGASRKRIVKRLTGEKVTGKDLGGNLAIALWSALNGASAVRVHDVRETAQALRVAGILRN